MLMGPTGDAFVGTAVETPIRASVRLTVRKDKPYVKTPHFESRVVEEHGDKYYTTTGVEAGESRRSSECCLPAC